MIDLGQRVPTTGFDPITGFDFWNSYVLPTYRAGGRKLAADWEQSIALLGLIEDQALESLDENRPPGLAQGPAG